MIDTMTRRCKQQILTWVLEWGGGGGVGVYVRCVYGLRVCVCTK